MVRVPIVEASAKVRSAGPVDDAADLELPVWAGVIPVATVAGTPAADEHVGREATAPVSRLRG